MWATYHDVQSLFRYCELAVTFFADGADSLRPDDQCTSAKVSGRSRNVTNVQDTGNLFASYFLCSSVVMPRHPLSIDFDETQICSRLQVDITGIDSFPRG